MKTKKNHQKFLNSVTQLQNITEMTALQQNKQINVHLWRLRKGIISKGDVRVFLWLETILFLDYGD